MPHVHPRSLIVVGPEAQCTIVEIYVGAGSYFTNAVTEIVASRQRRGGSLQGDRRSAGGVSTSLPCRRRLGTQHEFLFALDFAGRRAGSQRRRRDALGRHRGDPQRSVHRERHAARRQSHGRSTMPSRTPTATSCTRAFSTVRRRRFSTAAFIVRKDAQKTDSKQTNKNLVLSDEAVIDTKPELQIFADDVRCTHGATIGQLDAESMFYLRSRGIGKERRAQPADVCVCAGHHRSRQGSVFEGCAGADPVREIQ